MDVLGDLVARERRGDDLAIRTDSRAGSYSYEKCCTNAWKAGNLLRHYGVRADATVDIAVDDEPSPPALIAFLGSSLLGAPADFDPPAAPDGRAVVVPAGRVDEFDPQPGTTALAYGGPVDDPRVSHFEREAWSENPTMPPDAVAPDAAALTVDGRTYSHERLLEAAHDVVSEYDLDEDSEVVLRAPLEDPAVVASGVLAPLVAGGTIGLDRTRTGTAAVGTASPAETRIDPAELL